MTKEQKQYLLLGVLFVTLVGVLIAQTITSEQTTVASPPSNQAASRPATAAASGQVEDLKLHTLPGTREALEEPRRNPFRFEAKAPPPSSAPAVRLPPPPVASLPPVPAGPPPPPPIPLKFIGFVEPPDKSGRVAMMSDSRGSVFLAREGDIIEGRYRLLRVGTDSADLSYTDGRGRQTLRLSGQ